MNPDLRRVAAPLAGFTPHALARMRLRGITAADADAAREFGVPAPTWGRTRYEITAGVARRRPELYPLVGLIAVVGPDDVLVTACWRQDWADARRLA